MKFLSRYLCNALLSSDSSPQQATRAREQSYPHQGALVLIAIFSHQDLIHLAHLSLSFSFVSLLIFFIFLSFFFFFPFPSLFLSLLPVFSSLLQVQKQKTKNKIIYGFMPNICLSNKIQIIYGFMPPIYGLMFSGSISMEKYFCNQS